MYTWQASFRFYAELNDFLKPANRFQPITLPFHYGQSVKHLVESLGVPHPEIDLILANEKSVGFDYLVQNGDQISVYPVFESINITAANHLRPQPLRVTRFVLDGHLGRLAALLRMLGFDTRYRNDFNDEELAAISFKEKRILLTRDRGLLKRKQVSRGYCLRSMDAYQQLYEIVRRFDLLDDMHPFTRCMACNGLLQDVDKADILLFLQPLTRKYFQHFKQCADCGKVYWKGSHYEHMQNLISRLISDIKKGADLHKT
ncbi:MAG: Mut7-C ubiquitin/RNAse domain-containing protein [Anaerolineaceae bacterium]|nr:Mut7-C ubiquitin/RNAse domain-containing protein [Anaerolineaceae bacterium]